jgi:S1-C subfamily serine protease
MVTGYAPTKASARNNNTAVIAREHALGSGVILASDGYIVTNAHVVEGAQRIQVALAQRDGTSPFDISPVGRRKILEAKLVGSDKETDLALLKVDAHNLNVLPLGATRPVYPGEVVLAVGSPEGLQSSITMGVDRLGVYVVDLNDRLRAALPDLRFPSGVIVVAQSSELNSASSRLRAGDIIHTLNQTPIDSVQQLRAILRDLRLGQAVVLQIERAGKLQYVAFD